MGKLLVDNRPGETAVGPQGPAGMQGPQGPTTEYFDNGVSLGNYSQVDLAGNGILPTEDIVGILKLTVNDGSIIRNVTCDSSVFVGAFVRMTTGGTAVNALADSYANSNVIGLVETKHSPTSCTIRVFGRSTDIFAGLDPAKDYYLSTTVAGGLQDTPPVASGTIMLKIGQPFSATSFLMSKGERVQRA